MEILFVCTGNTCRSPMAEGLFRKQAKEKPLTGYDCSSAGLCAQPGQPVTANAVTACAEIGVDISNHKSRILCDESAGKTDLFVAMTKDHASILKSVGIPCHKIRILGDGIPDPYGWDIDVYRMCRDRIAAGVAQLIDELASRTGQEKNRSDNIVIVSLAEPHVPGLAKIERLCFSDPWSEQSLTAELNNPTALFYVALCDDTPVGYIGLHHVLGEGYMTNIAVHPDYRRQGIARRLTEWLLTEARRKKLSFVTLEVRPSNKAAITLYESMGFARVGTRRDFYRHPTEDALLMTIDLCEETGREAENDTSDEEKENTNSDENFEH